MVGNWVLSYHLIIQHTGAQETVGWKLVVVLSPDYPAHRSTGKLVVGNWWLSFHLIIQHTGAQEAGGRKLVVRV